MYLEIVSPEATLFAGEVTSVTVPGVDGEFQLLENHAAIVSLLQKGNVKFKGNNVVVENSNKDKFSKGVNGETVLAISSGTIEMKNNKIVVLAD